MFIYLLVLLHTLRTCPKSDKVQSFAYGELLYRTKIVIKYLATLSLKR